MARFDYDLFVIGAGSGGVRAARIAAGYGARVAIAEEYRVGGTCVIRGCVPKKLLSYAAHFHEEFDDAAGFGWTVPPAQFSWTRLIDNKDREIDRLNAIYKKLLSDANVTLIESRAVLADPHTIDVGGKRVTAATILIATGAAPVNPKIPGAELGISSNEAFHLRELPRHILVVGGGYIAVEFAGIFNGLGAQVTQLYRGPQILRGFDDDVRNHLAREMRKKQIDLRVNSDLISIAHEAGQLRAVLTDGTDILVDQVMFATGRQPLTAGMGLPEAGVILSANGAVAVDAQSRSAVPHIYAVGDCTDRLNLTPAAIKEGHAFADTVFGNKPWQMNYDHVASAVFSNPTVGAVGLTEESARQRYGEIDIYRAVFRPMKHTLSGRDERALMKLVVDKTTQKVLGAHMVGPDAPEIIQAVAIAVTMGATKQDFDRTLAIHPTAAEEFVTMRLPIKR